jgi:Yip1 domain
MDVLEILYDYFEDRPHAAALIRQRRPYALGLLGVLGGGASLFVAQALAGRLFLLPFSWPSLILVLLWQVAALFALTAILHLILEMTGARGDAGALFVHLGLSQLAWLAAVPTVLIAQALFPSSPWPLRLAFLAVGLWSLALKARGMRDEYGVGEGRAWLTLSLPYLALAALAALSTTLAVVSLILRAVAS